MRENEVTTLVVGPARSGKSYWITKMIVERLLPYGVGRIHHNLPIDVDELCRVVGPLLAKMRGHNSLEQAESEIRGRLVEIPKEEFQRWCMLEGEGLWSYFGLDGFSGKEQLQAEDVILLDECHLVFPLDCPDVITLRASSFFGELGHEGASAFLITQHKHKLSRAIYLEAAEMWQLSRPDKEVEELSGIYWGDLWQILAYLTGKWLGGGVIYQYKREDNRFVKANPEPTFFRFNKSYFKILRSQHSRHTGKNVQPTMPWQRLTPFYFLRYIVQRNALQLMPRVFKVLLFGSIFAIIALGGSRFFMSATSSVATMVMSASSNKQESKPIPKKPEQLARAPIADPKFTASAEAAASALPKAQAEADRRSRQLIEQRALAMEAIQFVSWQTAVVLLSTDHVAFDDGQIVKVGDKVPHGPYADLSVTRVDLSLRLCQLSNGLVLRLGNNPTATARNRTGAVAGDVSAGDTGFLGVSRLGGSSIIDPAGASRSFRPYDSDTTDQLKPRQQRSSGTGGPTQSRGGWTPVPKRVVAPRTGSQPGNPSNNTSATDRTE